MPREPATLASNAPEPGRLVNRILPRFDFRVDVVSRTEKGPVRELNEDALLVAPALALFGVADGMGGLDGGEVASRLALDASRETFSTKEAQKTLDAYVAAPQLENRRKVLALMRRACESAHEAVLAEQDRRGPDVSMGTTLDLCLLVRDRGFFGHVGDGRAFLARPSATILLTQDHVRHADAAYSSRGPKPLQSAIGVRAPLVVDTFFVELHKGDRIVLATDGAYTAVPDEAAMTKLCQKSPDVFVNELCDLAIEKGGRDNSTVVVVRVGERFLSRSPAAAAGPPLAPGPTSQREHDFAAIQQNPLFADLPASRVLAALAAGIELDLAVGAVVRRVEAGDLCAYLVLDGVVKIGTTSLGAPALLFAESLVGVAREPASAVVTDHARLVRLRGDDFREVCTHDANLGAALFERLARHLARTL